MRSPRALYPATLDLGGANVVVVGAGAVALRKLQGLPKGLRKIRVLAPEVSGAVARWAKGRREVEIIRRGFEAGDLRGCRILFCCADDLEVNAFAARQARALGAWVCQASNPGSGDLHVPAVVKAAGLQLTLSTGGASPAMAKALRAWFEESLKASDLEWFLGQLEVLRPSLKADPALAQALRKRLSEPGVVERALAPRSKLGRSRLQALLKIPRSSKAPKP
jgi:precorrin-2 dehydrogenase / sirohydrochlorin ferrochelatase